MFRQRVIVITLIAWLPLLVLSPLEGRALGGDATVPFLFDCKVHVRYLVALTLLIVAELVVHQRMRPVIQQFLGRNLIPASAMTLGIDRIRAGDIVLVSGSVGDHGIAVMLAREQLGLRGDLQSDAASVLPLTTALAAVPGLRFMRDPTRGGLATVTHEIVQPTGLGVVLREANVPVRDSVRSVCEMLGYDPNFLACEGRVVAVVAPDDADRALAALRSALGG